MYMAKFQETLDRLGLAQYHDGFVAKAFDSWQVLAHVTKEDLDTLGVKLGHRRVLQRAIAGYQRDGARSLAVVDSRPQANFGNSTVDGHIKTDDKANGINVTSQTATAPKRKYRRHPKPDENAPERPPSAYVIFSNQVRENLRDQGQELSFTEIAKAVDEAWQVLPHEEKGGFMSRSQAGKDRYHSQIAEYKKTKDFAEYQKYLVGFKTKHEGTRDVKRKKGDKPSAFELRQSDDNEGSVPANEVGSTHSDERHHSDVGSPISASQAGNISPKTHHYDVGASGPSSISPRHTTSDLTAIQPPRSQRQHPQRSPRSSLSHQVGHMNRPMRYEHPMTLSTSMAFGFTSPPPSSGNNNRTPYSNHSSISPLLIAGGPNRDHARLPPIRRLDLLNAPNPPFSGQLVASESPLGGFSNRQLPPPIPSRPSNSAVTGRPTSLKPEHLSQHSSGGASLLQAGEHLASNEGNLPPTKNKEQPENRVSSTHDTPKSEYALVSPRYPWPETYPTAPLAQV